MNHPAYQVPPALILLPAEGGKIKVYICAIKYHSSFQILYSVVVEEETEARRLSQASICQSKVKPTVSFSLE